MTTNCKYFKMFNATWIVYLSILVGLMVSIRSSGMLGQTARLPIHGRVALIKETQSVGLFSKATSVTATVMVR